MKTGKDVTRNGVYNSECCVFEIELEKKDMFPRCPRCFKLTLWELVDVKDGVSAKKAA